MSGVYTSYQHFLSFGYLIHRSLNAATMSQRNNLRAPPSPMTSWVLFPPTPACSTEPDEVTLPPSTPLNVTVPDSPFSSCGGDPSFTSFTDSFGIPPTPSSMTSFVAGSPDSLPDEESVFFPDALLAAGEPSNVGNQELPDLGHLDLSNLVKEELKNTIQKRRREGGLEEIDLTSQDFQPKKKTEPRESKVLILIHHISTWNYGNFKLCIGSEF